MGLRRLSGNPVNGIVELIQLIAKFTAHNNYSHSMNKKYSRPPVYLIATVIVIALLGIILLINPFKFHDHLLEPPFPVADFSLQTAGNQSFRLSEQQGKVVLLFFGYTGCDDVCPTTLATFKEVHDLLKDDAQKVRFVMITTDPDRDTPDKVAGYVAQFSPDFIGLGGSSSELESVWKELGVFVDKEKSKKETGYILMHTASVYVIDQNGILQLLLPYGTSATDMTDDIVQMLKQSK